MVLDQLINISKIIKLDPYFTSYKKINSKWIIDLSMRATTIKLLEQNTGIYLLHLDFGNGFLHMTPKPQTTK